MMNPVTLNICSILLNELDSWDPAFILAPNIDELWPTETVYSLAEVTRKVRPHDSIDGLTIRPSDVDQTTGDLTLRAAEKRGWVYRMNLHGGLQSSDLLISRTRPAIHINNKFSNLQFSSQFTALRPLEDVDGLWLWACLNSSPGVKVRSVRGHFTGNLRPGLDPAGIPIPAPVIHWNQVRDAIAALAAAIASNVSTQDSGRSWWRLAQLPMDQSWGQILAAPDPAVFMDGERFGDLIKTSRSGKRPALERKEHLEQALPVWGVPQTRGKSATTYATPKTGVVAEPGDILIQRTGSKGTAVVANEECLVDSTLILVKLDDPSRATAVAAALNSPSGQRQRAFRVTGAFIPNLGLNAVSEIRLQFDDSAKGTPPTSNKSLATQIDELVWT